MYHQVKILSSWILLVATVMLPVVTVEASASGAGMAVASRARHGGCNFRIGKISIRKIPSRLPFTSPDNLKQ